MAKEYFYGVKIIGEQVIVEETDQYGAPEYEYLVSVSQEYVGECCKNDYYATVISMNSENKRSINDWIIKAIDFCFPDPSGRAPYIKLYLTDKFGVDYNVEKITGGGFNRRFLSNPIINIRTSFEFYISFANTNYSSEYSKLQDDIYLGSINNFEEVESRLSKYIDMFERVVNALENEEDEYASVYKNKLNVISSKVDKKIELLKRDIKSHIEYDYKKIQYFKDDIEQFQSIKFDKIYELRKRLVSR